MCFHPAGADVCWRRLCPDERDPTELFLEPRRGSHARTTWMMGIAAVEESDRQAQGGLSRSNMNFMYGVCARSDYVHG